MRTWPVLLAVCSCWTGQGAPASRDEVASARRASIAEVHVTCETHGCVPPIAVANIGRRRPPHVDVELRPPDSDPRLGDDPLTFFIPSLACTLEPGEHPCRIHTLQTALPHQASFVGFSVALDEQAHGSSLRLRIEWSYCNDRLAERLGRVCTRDRGHVSITLAR